MAQDNISNLYNAIKDEYDVGSEEDFRLSVANADNRKNLYDAIKDEYDVGSEEDFEASMGYGPNAVKAPEAEAPAVTASLPTGQAVQPQVPQVPQEQTPWRARALTAGGLPTTEGAMYDRMYKDLSRYYNDPNAQEGGSSAMRRLLDTNYDIKEDDPNSVFERNLIDAEGQSRVERSVGHGRRDALVNRVMDDFLRDEARAEAETLVGRLPESGKADDMELELQENYYQTALQDRLQDEANRFGVPYGQYLERYVKPAIGEALRRDRNGLELPESALSGDPKTIEMELLTRDEDGKKNEEEDGEAGLFWATGSQKQLDNVGAYLQWKTEHPTWRTDVKLGRKNNSSLAVEPLVLVKHVDGSFEQVPAGYDEELGRKLGDKYVTENGSEYDALSSARTEQSVRDNIRLMIRQIKYEQSEDGELKQAYEERDRLNEALEKRTKELSNNEKGSALRYLPSGYMSVSNTTGTKDAASNFTDTEFLELFAAKKANDERIRDLEAMRAERDGTFVSQLGRSIVDYAFNPSTWDGGITDFIREVAMLRSKTGANTTEREKEAEQSMLENTAKAEEVAQKAEKVFGNGYKWGRIAAQSLPFAMQFMAGNAMGMMGGITRGGRALGVRAARRIVMRDGSRNVLRNFSRSMLRNTGVLVGDLGAAAALSTTLQAGQTTADVLNRHVGKVTYDDKSQTYKLAGGKSLGRSIYEGVANSVIENYTELLGEHIVLGKFGKWALTKIGLGKVSEWFTRIGKKGFMQNVNKYMKMGGFNGYPQEVLEEEIGIPLNALFVGDSKFGDLLNGGQQMDIAGGMLLSMAAMGGATMAMAGARRGGMAILYQQDRKKVAAADKVASMRLTAEKWSPIKGQMDDATNADLGRVIAGILGRGDLSIQEKEAVWDYAQKLINMRGHNLGEVAAVRNGAVPEGADAANSSYTEGYNTEAGQKAFDEAKGAVSEAQRELDAIFGEHTDPMQILTAKKEDGTPYFTKNDRDKAQEVVNARLRYEGMARRVRDDIEDAAQQAGALVDSRTNHDTGKIQQATLQGGADGGERTVYIVGGRVATAKDGSIDAQGSDMSLVVVDERGRMQMVSPDRLSSVEAPVDGTQAREAAMREAEQEKAQEIADNANEVAQDTDTGTAEGTPKVPTAGPAQPSGGAAHTTPPDVEAEISAYYDARTHEDTGMLQPVVLKAQDADGKDRTVYVVQGHVATFDDGTIDVRASDPRLIVVNENGEREMMSPDKLLRAEEPTMAALAKRQAIAEAAQGQQGSDPAAPVEGGAPAQGEPAEPVGPTQTEPVGPTQTEPVEPAQSEPAEQEPAEPVAAEQEQPAEGAGESGEGAENAPMPMRDGEEDWAAVTPERAHAYLFGGEAGLSRSEGNAFVAAQIDAARKRLKKEQGQEPKMGTSIKKYKEEKAQHQGKMDEVQATLDYWQRVKSLQDEAAREEQEAAVAQDAPAESGQTQTGEAETVGAGEEERRPGVHLTEEQANQLLSAMEEQAEDAPEIELTPQAWSEVFDENNSTDTPIGRVKMGDGQITKFLVKGRTKEFGMVGPTLKNPDVILEEPSEAKDGHSERGSSYVFVKTFNRNGEKIKFYASITVKQDGMEVSISSHYMNKNAVSSKMQESGVLYIRKALLPNSSEWHLAEQQNAVPDLLPTQGNDASQSGDAAEASKPRVGNSTGKGSEKTAGSQTKSGKTAGAERTQAGESTEAGEQANEETSGNVPTGQANKTEEPAPVGKGPFGNIYDQFKGKAKEAFTFLMKLKEGDLLGVFHREDVGDIDLVWGDENGGLAHILSKHVGKGKSFKNADEAIAMIDKIIKDGKKEFENSDKLVIRLDGKQVVVRKNYRLNGKKIADTNWVLTAYDEKAADGGVSAIGTTNEGEAARATDLSTGKGRKKTATERTAEGEKQSVLQGFYKAEPVQSDFSADSGYMRNAEKKAVKDVNGLFRALVKVLGIADPTVVDAKGKKQKNVTANIAPVGGDIVMRIPLGAGYELNMRFGFEPAGDVDAARDRGDASPDSLVLNAIRYRVEDTGKSGQDKYVTRYYEIPVSTNLENMLGAIRKVAGNWLPRQERAGGKMTAEEAAAAFPFTRGNGRRYKASAIKTDEQGARYVVQYEGEKSINGTSLERKLTVKNAPAEATMVFFSPNGVVPIGYAAWDEATGEYKVWDMDGKPVQIVREERAGSEAAALTEAEVSLRDAVAERMRQAGIETSLDDEEGQRVLDLAERENERVRAEAKRKALPTASVQEEHQPTVVDSANGAKVLKKLDGEIEKLQNSSNRSKTFIGDIANAIGASKSGSNSAYATFETKNGKIVTIRLSNHNARVSTFDNNGEAEGISIVVTAKGNNGISNDGQAHVVEYHYDAIKLRKAEGKPLAEIVRSIKQALYSGEYKDTTGLAERQEVNVPAGGVREMRAYHGSGARFDEFDSSHMGEGEGAQAHGHGHYVAVKEGTARGYGYDAQRTKNAGATVFLWNGEALNGDDAVDAIFESTEGLGENRFDNENRFRVQRMLDKLANGETKKDVEDYLRDEAQDAYWQGETQRGDAFEVLRTEVLPNLEINEEETASRYLYSVEIPENKGGNYIEEGKEYSPRGKDAKRIKQALYNHLIEHDEGGSYEDEASRKSLKKEIDGDFGEGLTGRELYRNVAARLGSDEAASAFLHDLGYKGIHYYGRQDGECYVVFDDADLTITDRVRFFRGTGGEVLGFTVGGRVYLDPRRATAETPLHEYTHLWAGMLRSVNPSEWANVVELMKGEQALWEEVRNRYPELAGDDDALAEEVLAHYSGRRGAERLRQEQARIAAGTGSVGAKARAIAALERLKAVLGRFWHSVSDLLGLHFERAEEVADQVLGDLARGVNPTSLTPGPSTVSPTPGPSPVGRGENGRGGRIAYSLGDGRDTFNSRQRKAVQDKGTVMGGLNNESVRIVDVPRHQYTGSIKEATRQAIDAATAKYAPDGKPKPLHYNNHGEAFDYTISPHAIAESLNPNQQAKSDNKGVHLAIAEHLDEVIGESIEAEEHPDYQKNEKGKRVTDRVNQDALMHRFFGAITIDGVPYRMMTLMREDRRPKEGNGVHAYEVNKVELLGGSSEDNPRTALSDAPNSSTGVGSGENNSSYPLAKLLQNVEKSYDNGKKLLDESAKADEDNMLYRTSDEIDAEYPNWLEGTTTDSGKHSTQVAGTRKTYGHVGDWIESHLGKGVRILDASSGMGYGTQDLRERGFNIEDVEPYQSEERKKENPATYSSYDQVEGKYDYIISNAVLNVIPDNWRSDVLHDMAERLKVGGRLFINTRKAGEEKGIKDKIELDSPQEVLVKRNGRIASYQRFFTPEELRDYVARELGSDYEVEIANERNSGTKGLAAVVVTKRGGGAMYRGSETEQAAGADGRAAMHAAAEELATELGEQVEIVDDVESIAGGNATQRQRRRTAKGWYDPETGRVVVVLANHTSAADVRATVLHEVVGHKGLRALLGEGFDAFLDRAYNGVGREARAVIDAEAAQMARRRPNRTEERCRRAATEEYVARLAEQGFEDRKRQSIWRRIVQAAKDLLSAIRLRFGVRVSDADLRYMLWRSHELASGRSRTALGGLRDARMREATEREELERRDGREGEDIEAVNERFNEDIERYERKELPQGFRFDLGYPSAELRSAGFDNLPMSMRASLLARKAGDGAHPFKASDLKDLVKALQRPIAIFRYSKDNMRNVIVDVQHDGKHFLIGITLNYKANGIEINSVSGLFPKESHEWIKWIQDGKAIRIDQKEKVQSLIASLRTNPAESERIGLNLDTAAKVVENFENPAMVVEENSDELLYRSGDESGDGVARAMYNERVEAEHEIWREAWQDDMLPVRRMQEAVMAEAGGELKDSENAYIQENNGHGVMRAESEQYELKYYRPLLKAVRDVAQAAGMELRDVERYMMAKHGLERNEKFAERDAEAAFEAYKAEHPNGEKTQADFMEEFRKRDYSGLTGMFGKGNVAEAEEAARALVADVEGRTYTEALWAATNVEALWAATNAATKRTLRQSYEDGIISKDTYEKVRDMFSWYVPLRGFEDATAEDLYDYVSGGRTAFSPTLHRAKGRGTEAESPLAYIASMAESAIVQGRKNRTKQAFLQMALNHPTNLLTVSEMWYTNHGTAEEPEWREDVPEIPEDATADEVAAIVKAHEESMQRLAEEGRATKQRSRLRMGVPIERRHVSEHHVEVLVNGKKYVIYVNGSPRAAQALNGTRKQRASEHSFESSRLAELNRRIAQAYTSLSPKFVVRNLIRDYTMATAMTFIKEGPQYALRFQGNVAKLGGPMRMFQLMYLYRNDKLDMSKETQRLFYEFMTQGGETGFTTLKELHDYEKDMRQAYQSMTRHAADPREGVKAVMRGVELANRCIEDMSRFATYMASRQSGKSVAQSVQDAKNITLNFNRKGSGERGNATFRNLFIFVNPAIQAMHQVASAMRHHPGRTGLALGIISMAGMAAPLLVHLLAQVFKPDDGYDPEEAYRQLPAWQRQSNYVLWIPGTHKFLMIPLGQEFRAAHGLGEATAAWLMGRGGKEAYLDVASMVADLLPVNPEGNGWNPLINFLPTMVQPVAQVAFNTDFTGRPIWRETEWNKYDPAYQKAYVGTPAELVAMSAGLNELTGGNAHKQGKLERYAFGRYLNNPAVADHLLSGYFGGLYSFSADLVGSLWRAGQGELPDARELPIVNALVTAPRETEQSGSPKMDDRYYELKEENDRTAHELSGWRGDAERGDTAAAKRYKDFLRSEAGRAYLRERAYMQAISRLRGAAKRTSDAERRERLLHRIDSLQRVVIEQNQ